MRAFLQADYSSRRVSQAAIVHRGIVPRERPVFVPLPVCGKVAEQIVSAKINGQKLAFTKGPNSPLDFFNVDPPNFAVREATL